MADFKLRRIKYTWKGEWSSGDRYYVDDIVNYGGKAYVCIKGHEAGSGGDFYNDLNAVDESVPPQPQPRWEQMMDGYAWQGDWQANIPYSINDLVKYGGIVYKCSIPHTSSTLVGVDSTLVTQYGLENDEVNWDVYAATEDWKTDWQINTTYRLNDVVRYGGFVYRCTTAHTSAATEAIGLEIDISYWQVIHTGVDFKGTWAVGTRYKVNDLVKYGAQSWICVQEHVSETFTESDWAVYAPGLEYESTWQTGTNYQPGDVVKYGGYAYFAKTFNTGMPPSTEPADWELLSLGYNLRGDFVLGTQYRAGDVVRGNGWLYACIADTNGSQPLADRGYWAIVVTSFYWRNRWIDAIAYQINDIATVASDAYECIQAHTASTLTTPGSVGSVGYWKLYSQGNILNRLTTQGDISTFDSVSTRLPIGVEATVLKVVDGKSAWSSFNEIIKVYYVSSSNGVDIDTAGLTIALPFRTVKYACDFILEDEATRAPATIFIKTGYYEEELPINIAANVALVGDELRGTTIVPAAGYETEDMFYVRSGSGIRNMTLQGLTGTLGALNSNLTARPTGGAYVSLDPGTGTNDTSVWINSRSPYIQNVTTFGTGCVGLKIDGNLHDGGNKSVVANDFTQVVSDGIGVWVTNQALSELVSVFSYYAHIGYLAEFGGKIRATNGNSSYGTFGVVAEGVSTAEIPIQGAVNNRSTEATVASVIAGQAGDEILILEYSHCGQNYGDATYTFTGAGVGASVTANIRNNAVSEVRVYTRGDSSPAGGGSYLQVSNNAQAGDDLTITLAANDPNAAINYLGMRIIVTSGTGTGQYGYIQAYDAELKIVTVYKESDDTPGWDHVSEYTPELLLDTTSIYSIEPRVTFSAPGVGTTAKGRAKIDGGRISAINIWDCGAGYSSAPTITITDPNNTTDAVLQPRLASGVLGPVTWVSRGNFYQTTSTTVTILGGGFADKYQTGNTLVLRNMSRLPGPGDNLTIFGINDVIYNLTTVTLLGGSSPALDVSVTIFPPLDIEESPAQDTAVTIRQQYSQVRLTGHDFLDIGTGSFVGTDYPDLYKDYQYVTQQDKEVSQFNGGRVFYTSTDQDGNFRVGELFKVDQATGTVTISASLFSLSGLEELSLGGVTVGGTGVVIREFSTDSTFTADSNNIIPTQKAIKTYITSRVSGGGSDAFTGQITAGVVRIGGTDQLTTSSGGPINFEVPVNLNGGIGGRIVQNFIFANSWDSDLDYQD